MDDVVRLIDKSSKCDAFISIICEISCPYLPSFYTTLILRFI